ncbi:DUF374 domain-containing protein [candidate division KSB3 bacterium]|uniref:DUF374 domain-containing protein n=1 Tax=candidate division KSB3 bacterium TaxID=2044937 RepID=A0A9D5Q4F3_9BACT|nr:DUF374 domain-containing protein [candidate division KSB3 bacterium]MBD3323203.1 DUF374 domain-containing protein [candidate division KSB3 bacterium]
MSTSRRAKDFRDHLLQILIPSVGWGYLSLVGNTSRMSLLGKSEHDTLKRQYPHVIYVGWHEQILTGAWAFRRRGITILISQSRDGEYISRITHLLGFDTVRASSSRGGVRGFLQLLTVLQRTGDVIFLADGPRGPAKQCKAGVITLAKRANVPIIPTTVLASRYRRVRSWDRTIVPLPFSRFLLHYGAPFFVPPDLDKSAIEEYQRWLAQRLDQLFEQTVEKIAHPPSSL